MFNSMENNNFYSAAACRDSQVTHNCIHRFLLKKAVLAAICISTGLACFVQQVARDSVWPDPG